MTCCQVTALLCKIIQAHSSSSNTNNTQLLWITQLQVCSAPHVLKETRVHPAKDQSSVVSTRDCCMLTGKKSVPTARQEENIWNHHGPGDTWARHREKHRMENSSPFGQKLQIHFCISQSRQPQLAVINYVFVLCSQKGSNEWKHPKYRYIFALSQFTIHCNKFIEHTKLS